MPATQLSNNDSDGTVLGQSASDKIGFHGATPAAVVTGFVAPAATAATNSSPFGYSQAQADAIVTWIRAADAALKAKGLISA